MGNTIGRAAAVQPDALPVAQPVNAPLDTGREGAGPAVVQIVPPLSYEARIEKVEHIGFITVIVVSVLGIIGTLSSGVMGVAHLGYWGFIALTPAVLDYKDGKAINWKQVVEKVMSLLPLIFVNILGAFDLLSPGILGWINISLIGVHYLCRGVNIYTYFRLEQFNYFQNSGEGGAAAQPSVSIPLATLTSAATAIATAAAANANQSVDKKKDQKS